MIGEGSEIGYVELDTFFPLMAVKKDRVLLVALDGIMDPQNLGAILRTCSAAGVDGVILPERRSASITESAIRASAGTAGRVPIARVNNLGRALDDLKDAGAWILDYRQVMKRITTSMNLLIAPLFWSSDPKGKGCIKKLVNGVIDSFAFRCLGLRRA